MTGRAGDSVGGRLVAGEAAAGEVTVPAASTSGLRVRGPGDSYSESHFSWQAPSGPAADASGNYPRCSPAVSG